MPLSASFCKRVEPNFSGHLTPRCKTTSCHEDERKFTFPLGNNNQETHMAYDSPILGLKPVQPFVLFLWS